MDFSVQTDRTRRVTPRNDVFNELELCFSRKTDEKQVEKVQKLYKNSIATKISSFRSISIFLMRCFSVSRYRVRIRMWVWVGRCGCMIYIILISSPTPHPHTEPNPRSCMPSYRKLSSFGRSPTARCCC